MNASATPSAHNEVRGSPLYATQFMVKDSAGIGIFYVNQNGNFGLGAAPIASHKALFSGSVPNIILSKPSNTNGASVSIDGSISTNT